MTQLLFDIVLSAGALVLAALLFLAVRQIGILHSRLPAESLEAIAAHGIEVGEQVPVRNAPTYRAGVTQQIPIDDKYPTYLLFAAFSCPTCQPIIEELSKLSPDIGRRFLLCNLDGLPEDHCQALINEFNLSNIIVVDGLPIHEEYRIFKTPFLYCVSPGGRVMGSRFLFSYSELHAAIIAHENASA